MPHKKCGYHALLKWVRFDNNKFTTKFMPPPYNDETNALLYNLIETQAAAPKDWPEYIMLRLWDMQVI